MRCAKEYEPATEEAFAEYLDMYIEFIKKAKTEMADIKQRYKKAYHENDPGVGPMIVFFGKEWTDKFFRDFPF